jgi:Short C-terminal domain
MSLTEELSKLGEMFKEGLLSSVEFEQAKKELLNSSSENSNTKATIIILWFADGMTLSDKIGNKIFPSILYLTR